MAPTGIWFTDSVFNVNNHYTTLHIWNILPYTLLTLIVDLSQIFITNLIQNSQSSIVLRPVSFISWSMYVQAGCSQLCFPWRWFHSIFLFAAPKTSSIAFFMLYWKVSINHIASGHFFFFSFLKLIFQPFL